MPAGGSDGSSVLLSGGAAARAGPSWSTSLSFVVASTHASPRRFALVLWTGCRLATSPEELFRKDRSAWQITISSNIARSRRAALAFNVQRRASERRKEPE